MTKKTRDKLQLYGALALSDLEALEALGLTKGQAAALLDKHGTLAEMRLLAFPVLEESIGLDLALRLCAALDLGRRAQFPPKESAPVYGPAEALSWVRPALGSLGHEEMHLLLLDKTLRVIRYIRHSSGSAASTVLDAAGVCREALMYRASAVILAHNHPSGDVTPSSFDLDSTHKVKDALAILGIRLNDHFIIGAGDTFLSFAQRGLL